MLTKVNRIAHISSIIVESLKLTSNYFVILIMKSQRYNYLKNIIKTRDVSINDFVIVFKCET